MGVYFPYDPIEENISLLQTETPLTPLKRGRTEGLCSTCVHAILHRLTPVSPSESMVFLKRRECPQVYSLTGIQEVTLIAQGNIEQN